MPDKQHPTSTNHGHTEKCPKCGSPCRNEENSEHWGGVICHPSHDTLVQQAVDEAVREIWIALQHGHKYDGWYLAIEHITTTHPNAIPKDGE